MADVLARIVDRKAADVAARVRPLPRPSPTRRSLKAALDRPGARFILEAKQRSPSGHRARHSLDAALNAYAHVADSLSILTDGPDFGGSLDDLARARARYQGPILAKDFVVDPFQVEEARSAGADAVLVMLSVLDDERASTVMATARALGMEALVEVHDGAELERALALGAALVGINNRDLKTLVTDLSVTERLAPRVPPHVTLVSESGIAGHADVRRLSPRVDAFLVGSALMDAPDISRASRELVHGAVKLCGLTRVEDVHLAYRAGASHGGFIFVPGSPRALSVEQAAPLVRRARGLGLRTVGVFRDSDISTIAAHADAMPLDCVQLHGKGDSALLDDLRARLPVVEIIAVRAVRDTVVEPSRRAHRTLFDTADGGTGRAFDWALIEGDADLARAFLAGGIGPDNAAAAKRVGTYGLDVSSAVERAPGIKDDTRVRALFSALRPASRGEA